MSCCQWQILLHILSNSVILISNIVLSEHGGAVGKRMGSPRSGQESPLSAWHGHRLLGLLSGLRTQHTCKSAFCYPNNMLDGENPTKRFIAVHEVEDWKSNIGSHKLGSTTPTYQCGINAKALWSFPIKMRAGHKIDTQKKFFLYFFFF